MPTKGTAFAKVPPNRQLDELRKNKPSTKSTQPTFLQFLPHIRYTSQKEANQMITTQDITYLTRCIDLARQALATGDQPYGSILVSADNQILFEDHNHTAQSDHTQHPEFNIARWAGQNLTEEQKATATVYTSGEHCPMCAAAHGAVGLGRIVYATSSQQVADWQEEWGIVNLSRVIRRPIQDVITQTQVDGPVPELADPIKALHKAYYSKDHS